MKKYFIVILTISLVSGCSKSFLDKEPHELTDAAFWKTAEQAESALAGAYTPLSDEEALGGEEWCGLEAFSDIGYMNDNYPDFIAMSEFRANQNTENDLSLNSYREYFQVIKRASDVLAHVPAIEMDEAQKKRILGEANFLRAYGYFTLTNRYGGVPLYDAANQDESASVRATAEEIWATIESSLVEATSQLSFDHNEGRPGLGAAWGLLAKVYAFEKKWTESKAAAEMVINSGKHSLLPNYADLFTVAHEINDETLWALGARDGSNPITSMIMLPNDVWGGTHDEQLGAGWRLVSATENFYDSYQPDDVRKAATVAKRNVDKVTYNGVTDILKAPNNQSPIVCIKFQDYKTEVTNFSNGLDIPAIRFADVLLLHAEAIMNLNGGGPENRTVGVGAAAESFNLVRERAGLDPIAAPTFNDLMYERKMELAFEGGDRHFDLVRWGLAAEVYNALPAEGTYKPARTFVAPKNNLLPYPQREIDNSSGTITQNPGYN